MMRRWTVTLGVSALTLGTLLLMTGPAGAQWRRGVSVGVGPGYGVGVGVGSGYYGYPGAYYGRGYSGYPYRSYYGPGYSSPYYYGRGYDWGNRPYYSGRDYGPRYYGDTYSYDGPYVQGPSQGYSTFYSGPGTREVSPAGAATVEIQVPNPDAEIWFDGQKTQQRGTWRRFVSPSLDESKSYSYEIRARWTEDGRPIEQTKSVPVKAGDRKQVTFAMGAKDDTRRRGEDLDRPTPGRLDTDRLSPRATDVDRPVPDTTDLNKDKVKTPAKDRVPPNPKPPGDTDRPPPIPVP